MTRDSTKQTPQAGTLPPYRFNFVPMVQDGWAISIEGTIDDYQLAEYIDSLTPAQLAHLGLRRVAEEAGSLGWTEEADPLTGEPIYRRPITPAQGGEAPGGGEVCKHCDGERWVWGHELPEPSEKGMADDTRYTCPYCTGKRPAAPTPDPDRVEEAIHELLHLGQPQRADAVAALRARVAELEAREIELMNCRADRDRISAQLAAVTRERDELKLHFGEPGDWNDEAVFNAQCEAIDKHQREHEAMKAALEAARALLDKVFAAKSWEVIEALDNEYQAGMHDGPDSPTTGKDGR